MVTWSFFSVILWDKDLFQRCCRITDYAGCWKIVSCSTLFILKKLTCFGKILCQFCMHVCFDQQSEPVLSRSVLCPVESFQINQKQATNSIWKQVPYNNLIESLCLFLSPSVFQVVQSHIARNSLRLSCTVICDGDLNLWMLIWCYWKFRYVARKRERGTTCLCKSTWLLNISMWTDCFLGIRPCHHAAWYEPTSSLSCHPFFT